VFFGCNGKRDPGSFGAWRGRQSLTGRKWAWKTLLKPKIDILLNGLFSEATRCLGDSTAHGPTAPPKSYSQIPKIVPVPGFLLPNVAQNVALAQLIHGPFLNRAHPGQGAKNRYQVLKGKGSAGPGKSWDEYPFFKSMQGGDPLTVTVRAVPQEENWMQGGIISAAYFLERINYGERYVVIVTP
jgi:hypothetical protein